ncbi:MAG: hypothetical protein M0007_13920 [Actinomycetota bacterium]|nr:hypothetical protein [Actinomycetota bacterium]
MSPLDPHSPSRRARLVSAAVVLAGVPALAACSSSATSSSPTTGPVRGATATTGAPTTLPAHGVLGPAGGHFTVDFPSGPVPGTLPASSSTSCSHTTSVHTYAVSKTPNVLASGQQPSIPTYAVLVALFPDAAAAVTCLKSSTASVSNPKRVSVGGATGLEAVSQVAGSGTTPGFTAAVLAVSKGNAVYVVDAATADAATANSFLASFSPHS